MLFKAFFGHLRVVFHHKRLVRRLCFRAGLYRQGLLHDLSKFSPTEFIPSVRYYQGGKASPIRGERKAKGYSACWLHHKGRNKHHFEYWMDYAQGSPLRLEGIKMPPKYLCEMALDRIAASMTYNEGTYDRGMPLDYTLKHNPVQVMHPDTARELEHIYRILKAEGEDAMFARLKEILKNGY
ncbi:MAG: catalase [Clostridia bacterium]|nr:catalase [Clostridia bacterium]